MYTWELYHSKIEVTHCLQKNTIGINRALLYNLFLLMKPLEIGMFTGKSPSGLNIDWTDLNDLQAKALHAGCSDTSQDEMVVSSTLKMTARCSTCPQ